MPELLTMRKKFVMRGLLQEDLNANPFEQFALWLNQAIEAKLLEPNAFTLATVGTDLKPSQRTVLLKRYGEEGFLFFSEKGSKKSVQIEQNSSVGAHFAWLGLERQLKVEGNIEKVTNLESLKYFLRDTKLTKKGVWVSLESEIVSLRTFLEAKFEQFKTEFIQGKVTFPSSWETYIIKPTYFEFWQGTTERLHDRFEYRLQGDGSWKIAQL